MESALYLSQLTRVADLPGRRRLRSSSSQLLQVPPFRRSTVGRRLFPVAALILFSGTPCHWTFSHPPQYLFSVNGSRHFFSVNHSAIFYCDIFVLTVHALVDLVYYLSHAETRIDIDIGACQRYRNS